MSLNSIAKGESVRLVSGGPEMTVTNLTIDTSRQICCAWFEGDRLHQELFPAETLERVTRLVGPNGRHWQS